MRMHLVGIAASPWTERARWVLDHHRIDYRWTEYQPLLGGPWLRLFALRPTGRVTLPVLRDGRAVLRESFEIVQHAERSGAQARLLPDITAVIRWNQRSDRALDAGRLLAAPRFAASDAALDEGLPRALPALLASPLRALERARVRRRPGGRGLDPAESAAAEATLRELLVELRRGLARGPHLRGGRFSYADIAMASALHFVRPVSEAYLQMGPESRACRTQAALAGEFADLLDWRDQLYARHRPPINDRS
jgi:glutathione S-transferase